MKSFWSVLMVIFLASGALLAQQETTAKKNDVIVPSWAKTTKSGEPVFENPMEMPRFPGCEELEMDKRYPCSINKLVDFVSDNLKYPASAKEQKIEGTVMVEFIVDKRGNVIEPKITKSVSASLDAEALKVVKAMPRWIPAREEGTIVNSLMNFPIKFQLGKTTDR